jgi:hypothetical protein
MMAVPACSARLNPSTRTFSYTHKPGQGISPGQTLVLANHTAVTAGEHAILISWFTGSIPWEGFGDLIVSYYVDGEIAPSISAPINLLTAFQGSNTTDPQWSKLTPWGNAAVGRTAISGGAYVEHSHPCL